MKLTFYRIPAWLSKVTVEADAEKVIVTGMNLLKQGSVEFSYDELSSRIVRQKQGDVEWFSVGCVLLMIFLVTVIVINISIGVKEYPIVYFVELLLIISSAITFLLPIIFKEEYVWFHDKDKDVAFSIKVTDDNRVQAEDLIAFISNQITQNKEM